MKKKRLRHSIKRELILRLLGRAGIISAEVLVNLILTGATLPLAMMGSKSESLDNLKNFSRLFEGVDFSSEHSVYQLIARLERDGLIEKKAGVISLARRGIARLKKYLHTPDYQKVYTVRKKATKYITLIIFDIPEKEREKRDWLREKLVEIKFLPLQQSVWYSKYGISLAFISDLKQYNMLNYVHVMKVVKAGSFIHGRG